MPGFQYRDFLELFRIKEGLGGPALPPPAIIESLVVRIDARGLAARSGSDAEPAAGDGLEQATCPTEVSARVRQSRGGWAMVPLGLGQLLLNGPPQHVGPGRMLVDAEPDGFRCWFQTPAGEGGDRLHTVTLVGRLPVTGSPGRESFALRLPTAVASRVEVQTDRGRPRVETVPPGGPAETVVGDDGRLTTIAGLVGSVRIRLLADDVRPVTAVAAEADCRSVVRIDGRSARIDATLEISNLPPGTRQLSIGVPASTTLRRVGGDGSLLARQAGTKDETEPDTIALAVDPGPGGGATIELECERPVDPAGRVPLDPLGFAVAGIEPWRQRGRVSLVIEGDWQATWEDVPGVRRIDPAADEREPGLTAAFAYDSQPASLPLRVRPRRSRVVIEPEYRYAVSSTRVALDARLRVAVRGAPISSLVVGLDDGWSLADVGPAGVVDAAGVRSEAGQLTIPFLQPLSGDAVVEIEAARNVASLADMVGWSMPVPRADLVGPAAVIVSSDSDIELLPDPVRSVGLVRQTSSAVRPGDADRIALVYRLDAAEGTFVAARRFLPRRVEATVAARIAADDREIAVTESIRLDVLHLPLEFLELSLPEELLESDTLEIRQDGELLDALDVGPVAESDLPDRPLVTVRAFLLEPLLGRGEVTVAYRVPTPVIPPEATAAVDLPLPLPAAGSVRQSVLIDESATLALTPRGDAWRRDFSGQGGGGRSWSASKLQRLVPLAISARTREAAGVTIVEAAWLRTSVFPTSREDIATFVVSAAEEELPFELPAAAAAGTLEVRLDGSSVPLQTRGDGSYSINLSPPGRGGRLVEIRLVSPWGGTFFGLGLPWPLPLAAPTFPDEVIQRRFCWEVGLLPGDCLAGLPARWTSQQHWSWDGVGWSRQPTVSSAELADWVAETLGRPAVAVAAPGWPERERRAVYAGIGPPGTAAAWVMPTWCLVLAASGAALAIGLRMVFSPAWRRPAVVVGLLAAAAVAGAAVPDLAPLVGQAALPGGVLAVLAAVLQWVARPAAGRPRGQPAGSASSLTRTAAPTVSLIVASSEAGSTASAQRGAS